MTALKCSGTEREFLRRMSAQLTDTTGAFTAALARRGTSHEDLHERLSQVRAVANVLDEHLRIIESGHASAAREGSHAV